MIRVKGIREGLLFLLEEGNWEENRRYLLKLVEEREAFWRGAQVALDSRSVVLCEEEILALKDYLSQRGLTLWAVLSDSPSTQLAAQKLGLATRLNRPPKDKVPSLSTIVHDGEEALLINKTLRSGYRVEYAGHVVVLGDVNPGAEIIASGSIMVWGRLRGVAHAGAEGNTQAIVCALDLQPTQLRIAGQIALTPQRKGKPQPEVVRLQNGQLVAQPWNAKDR
ncbi:MAG: septum site-determining protein MinC [Anaerolineales bacterium]|nr:septum site-determining protein MinC [Anaerolineales bacterium]MDW8161922.1 septum site-determining protein MinC [Anaerolineales bacterium]